MSGETIKLVKVEDVAVRNLKERKARLRAQSHQCQEQIKTARQQAQQEFQKRLAAAKPAPALVSRLANLEQNTNRLIQQQRQQLQVSVQMGQQQTPAPANPTTFAQQRQTYTTSTNYDRLLQEQQQQFKQLVAQERSVRAQEQQQLQQQLQQVAGSLEQDRQRKQALAQDLIQDVQTLLQQMQQTYPDRPEVATLGRQLEMAQSNLQAGMSEAAIATAQQTYLSLSDLRLQLEQQAQECLLLYAAALEQVRSLSVEAQLAHQCEVEIGEGETAEIDVDYWTNGSLHQYQQQLKQLEAQLTAAIDRQDKAQVQQVSQQIQSIAPTLERLIEQAQLSVFGSQLRAEIADSVVDALSSLGYTLVDPDRDAIYEGDDQRQAYVVKVKNVAGDEVVAVISPEKEFGINSISVNAFSETIVDETAAQQNAQAVFDALEAEGIEGISPLQCNPEGKEEYRNMQTVKQRVQKRG